MLAAYTIYTSFDIHKNESRDRKVKTKLHTYLKYILSSLPHSVFGKTAFHGEWRIFIS